MTSHVNPARALACDSYGCHTRLSPLVLLRDGRGDRRESVPSRQTKRQNAMSRIPESRYHTGIYAVLEKHLRKAKKPLTCVDMLDHSDVRKFTEDTNRISNYLGHMWRKKLLKRHIAPPSELSMARFAYTWEPEQVEARPVEGPAHLVLKGKSSETDLTVTRLGNQIIIEGETLKLTIQLK